VWIDNKIKSEFDEEQEYEIDIIIDSVQVKVKAKDKREALVKAETYFADHYTVSDLSYEAVI
jgi:shikimate 5-dehydrogenase